MHGAQGNHQAHSLAFPAGCFEGSASHAHHILLFMSSKTAECLEHRNLADLTARLCLKFSAQGLACTIADAVHVSGCSFLCSEGLCASQAGCNNSSLP